MRISKARLEELVEKATVDAYGDEEQVIGLFTSIEENLELPFTAKILGFEVIVESVAIDRRDQIVAICRRGSDRLPLSILDLPIPDPPPAGWEWVEAYRHWV